MPAPLSRMRSVLFMPGNRPDMVAKIPEYRPDVAVADLEDAVATADKASARRLAAAAVDALDPGAAVVLIRVNPVGSPWFDEDVHAAASSSAAGIVVPKLAAPGDVLRVRRALAASGRASAVVIGGVETAPRDRGRPAGADPRAQRCLLRRRGLRGRHGRSAQPVGGGGPVRPQHAVPGREDRGHSRDRPGGGGRARTPRSSSPTRRRARALAIRARHASTRARSRSRTACSARRRRRWRTPGPCWPRARPAWASSTAR